MDAPETPRLKEISKTKPPSAEAKEIRFKAASALIIQRGFRLQGERFGPGSENPQTYHTEQHPRDVESRAMKIVYAINQAAPGTISERQRNLIAMGAAWHDVVQNWEPQNPSDAGTIREFRNRDRGSNEKRSAEELIDEMRKTNDQYPGEEIYTADDFKVVEAMMKATEPDFKDGSAIQPFVTKDSPIEAQVVAMSDLGEALMEDSVQFVRGGNGEFQELYVGITRAINNALTSTQGLASLSNEDREFIAQKIKAWIEKGQPAFAEGRLNNLGKELAHFNSPVIEEKLRKDVFNKYPNTRAVVQERADRIKELTVDNLEELVIMIGYKNSLQQSKLANAA